MLFLRERSIQRADQNEPNTMKSIEINPLDLINIKDILGCLYYIYSMNISVIIDRVEREYSVKSSIININSDLGVVTFKIEEGVYFKTDENIKVSFVVNEMRYGFDSSVAPGSKEGEITLKIPVVIRYDDNRDLPRVNLPDTVCNCLELVTGFFGGIRIKGKLEDISLGGMAFTPSNVESIKNSNEIDLKDTMIKTGDKFRKLKFEIDKNVVNIPVEICHTPTEERNTLGIKFDISKDKEHNKIRNIIQTLLAPKKFINFASFYEKYKANS